MTMAMTTMVKVAAILTEMIGSRRRKTTWDYVSLRRLWASQGPWETVLH